MKHGSILAAVSVLALSSGYCSAQKGVVGDSSVTPVLGKRGTATTFVKWQEIEIRDSLSRGRRPVPVDVAVRNLAKYDAIWSANYVPRYNLAAWRRLRREHPQVLTLYYMSSDTTAESGSGYFDYEFINTKHPEWFVSKNATGSMNANPRDPAGRVRWSQDPKSPHYNRYFLDVCNPDFQKWATEQVVDRVSGTRPKLKIPYHGYAADNVNIGRKALAMIGRRGANWAYANRSDDWNAGFCAYLKTMRAALNRRGFILVANHSLEYGTKADAGVWDLFLESVDGVMTERAIGYGREIYTEGAWLLSIERHERILERGLIDWWVCYPPRSESAGHERFMYNYCSWLLVKHPGRSFFFSTRGDPGYRSNSRVPWYEEYNLPIGEPTSPRYRTAACWARTYANALIIVNPTRETQTVQLDANANWIESSSQQARSEVRMPPTSGRIFLSGLRRAEPD